MKCQASPLCVCDVRPVAPQQQLSTLQMATAVEGKSSEHILKALEDADTERASLRGDKAELQKELDAAKALCTEQQERLVELQTVKLALADSEAKVCPLTDHKPHLRAAAVPKLCP